MMALVCCSKPQEQSTKADKKGAMSVKVSPEAVREAQKACAEVFESTRKEKGRALTPKERQVLAADCRKMPELIQLTKEVEKAAMTNF